MLKESERLDNFIQAIQTQLSQLPEGKIICSHNGNYSKWYYMPDTKENLQQNLNHNSVSLRKYIPKSSRTLAEKLAYKKYLLLQLEEAICEKRAIDFYLNHHSKEPLKSSLLLTEIPAYKELLSPYFKPVNQQLADWAKKPFHSNPKYPEHLIHKSISGNIVRSKSEALIDMMLYTYKIPFRYECALQLDDIIIYPDFTIRHPITGKTFYWEHFGMMNNSYYQEKTAYKLQRYITHNIIPSIQLITTYETNETPLTSNTIEKIIRNYFLDSDSSVIIGV